MQELLGRLRALDPDAVISLRIIACFDELIVGRVNSRALLSAAASLTGCAVGFETATPARTLRVSPSGEHLTGPSVPPTAYRSCLSDGRFAVWIEREGEPYANDDLILERLSLALRVRREHSGTVDPRRDIGLMIDAEVEEDRRREAAARQNLTFSARYRFVVAPLFATWRQHSTTMREDVVATPVGPLHALIVPESVTSVDAGPVGVGQPSIVSDFPRAFRSAVVALRLTRLPDTPVVLADDYGGLLDVLADVPPGHVPADVPAVMEIARHAWGPATLDALVRTGSVREAARLAGVHHSTMGSRLIVVSQQLGFDPMEGLGRVRLGLAYLMRRLRESNALSMPAPIDGVARTA